MISLLAALSSVPALPVSASPESATITSGGIFTDTSGKPVHAHGAGIILPDSHPAGHGTPSSYIRPAAVMHARMHVTHGRTSGHIASVSPSRLQKTYSFAQRLAVPARPHSCTNQLRYISESFGKAQTMRAIIDATPPHAPSRIRYCLGVTGSIL